MPRGRCSTFTSLLVSLPAFIEELEERDELGERRVPVVAATETRGRREYRPFDAVRIVLLTGESVLSLAR